MARDQFGCQIRKGNRVVLKLGSEMVAGIVVEVDDGTITAPSGQPRPGHMVTMVDLHTHWDPRGSDRLAGVILTRAQPEVGDAAFTTAPQEKEPV